MVVRSFSAWCRLGCALGLVLTAAFVQAEPDGYTYIDASVKGGYTATDSDGQAITVTNWAHAVITAMYNGNCNFEPQGMVYSSMTFAAPRTPKFWTDNHWVTIGAGGIAFRTNSVYVAGRQYELASSLTIAADQTWSGLDFEMTERPVLSIGYPFYSNYWEVGLRVQPGVHALRLEKSLDVYFTGKNSSLGEVDLTVAAPAQLYLIRDVHVSPVTNIDARLSARSLTLAGDGAPLALSRSKFRCWMDGWMSTCQALDALHYAPILNLRDGADVAAEEACVFAVPQLNVSGTPDDTSAWAGFFTVTQAVTEVTLAGGAVLDLTGATLVESGVAASLHVTGNGVLRLAPAMFALTGGITFDSGVTLEMIGPGDVWRIPLAGDGTILIDPGADEEVGAGDFAQTTGSLIIASGRVVMSAGDGALTSVTVRDGAARVDGGGLIVTDLPYPASALTVGPGETLCVYGSGLGAGTSVTLDGGTISFRRTATIAAPMAVMAATTVGAATTNVTAEFAGHISCTITNGIGFVVCGLGRHVFSGGFASEDFAGEWWNLARTNNFYAIGGDVTFKTGEYYFGNGELWVGGTNNWSIGLQGRPENWCYRLTVGAGANVSFAERNTSAGAAFDVMRLIPPVDSADYRANVTLEVAAGGKVTIPRNRHFYAGSNQAMGTIELTGGTFQINRDSTMLVGYGGYSTGEIILRSGTLALGGVNVRHQAAHDALRVLWYGGTIRLLSTYQWAYPIIGGPNRLLDMTDGCLKSCCQILGDDCVLDLGDCAGVSVTNTYDRCDRNEWIGSGTLTVRGGSKCKEFVCPSFPSGVKLKLENGARVYIPADARIYDSAKSDYGWVRPWPQSNYSATDEWLMPTNRLTLAAFSPGAADVAVTAGSDDLELTIGAIRVPSGGWWNNAAPFFATLAGRWSFTDLAFEAGAEWNLSAADLANGPLAVSGAITLPDAPDALTLSGTVSVPAGYGDLTLATAAGAVTGNPAAVTPGGGRTYVKLIVDAGARNVRLAWRGFAINLR